MGFEHELKDLPGELSIRLFQNREYADWRQKLGLRGCYDIDGVVSPTEHTETVWTETKDRRICAIIETKHWRVSRREILSAMTGNSLELADNYRDGVPLYVVRYWPVSEHPAGMCFTVWPGNDKARVLVRQARNMSERRYTALLWQLRGTSPDKCALFTGDRSAALPPLGVDEFYGE